MLDLTKIHPVKKLEVKKIAEWAEGFLNLREDGKVEIFVKRTIDDNKIKEMLHQCATLEEECDCEVYAQETRSAIRDLEKKIQYESRPFYKDKYYIDVPENQIYSFLQSLQDFHGNGMWSCLYYLGRPVSSDEFEDTRGNFPREWGYCGA